MWVKQVSLIA
jgi:hypothetical protein